MMTRHEHEHEHERDDTGLQSRSRSGYAQGEVAEVASIGEVSHMNMRVNMNNDQHHPHHHDHDHDHDPAQIMSHANITSVDSGEQEQRRNLRKNILEQREQIQGQRTQIEIDGRADHIILHKIILYHITLYHIKHKIISSHIVSYRLVSSRIVSSRARPASNQYKYIHTKNMGSTLKNNEQPIEQSK
jgi:hypothetical protein